MSDVSSQSITNVPYNDFEANSSPQPVTVGTIIKGVFWGMWLFYISAAIVTASIYALLRSTGDVR